MKLAFLFLVTALGFSACDAGTGGAGSPTPDEKPSSAVANSAATAPIAEIPPPKTADGPKTIRDFFNLLPDKYFVLEGCDRQTDKDCKKARAEYLKTFTEVEDIKNGYFKGGCDGAQSCIEMTIFKRPDETYLVAVMTSGEMMNDFYFLDYKDGKWTDISEKVVPDFSKKNWYELPRVGTTVRVFSKKITEKGDDYEISEKGRKLYDLVWKDGTFTRK